MTEHDFKAEAQQTLYAKITEAAKAVDFTHGVGNSGATLRDLAEAYAWITTPNNAH
ncbi:hypothetical protein ACFWNT_19285 [Streptomyces sp. NPDC058409]|uniref:hypothetical protein n=1 Tax=Streptomyces sp. NPDC058409 TaxID=3346484 RepID=UPI003665F483